jgi:hypothetical protein
MRPERAIARHWQLVTLACAFSLLVGALPQGAATDLDAPAQPAAPAATPADIPRETSAEKNQPQ